MPHNTPPSSANNPTDSALEELAIVVHQDLMHKLSDTPYGEDTTDDNTDPVQDPYRHMLLGDLAMYIAEVQLPHDATESDREQGVTSALKTIAATPSLLDAITRAPYRPHLAARIAQYHARELRPADPFILGLQEQVARLGYFDRSMATEDRVFQLIYRTHDNLKTKHFGGKTLPKQSDIVVKVKPEVLKGTVKGYTSHTPDYGYAGLQSSRSVSYDGAFHVLSVSPSERLSKKLNALAGTCIFLGEISTDSLFKIKTNVRVPEKELVSSPVNSIGENLTIPATLQQVYVGDTDAYPLFTTD